MGPNQFHPECGKYVEKGKKKRKTLFYLFLNFLATPHVGF